MLIFNALYIFLPIYRYFNISIQACFMNIIYHICIYPIHQTIILINQELQLPGDISVCQSEPTAKANTANKIDEIHADEKEVENIVKREVIPNCDIDNGEVNKHEINSATDDVKLSDNIVANNDMNDGQTSNDLVIACVTEMPDILYPIAACKDVNFNDTFDEKDSEIKSEETRMVDQQIARRKKSVIERAANALLDCGESLRNPAANARGSRKLSGEEGLCGHPILLGAMYTLATMYNLLGQDALSTLAYTLILICMFAFLIIK